MTDDETQALRELHDFFMKPSIKGKKSRAEMIDELLTASTSAKFAVRAFLYLCSFIIAVSTAYAAVRGWGIFK